MQGKKVPKRPALHHWLSSPLFPGPTLSHNSGESKSINHSRYLFALPPNPAVLPVLLFEVFDLIVNLARGIFAFR